ncbi:AraC family transcriptional regulator [Phenylobacterium sp.]|jgi:AraC-like DNA-binding protein|uniref:helix-turn-helix domain-containing protein n=1 Tax=Phenylobacterium sp. TaxID=1871053 RepID=UPI002E300AA0|nr:AraC family transcriptional regulator [Phenylobacterium sp.]HEX3364150.1 AraC family transcriptional regulator [Phenylobacterium sp.]
MGALSERLVSLLGLQRRPAQLTGALGKTGVMVAKIREDSPQLEMTHEVPEDDAYIVGLIPRDYPDFCFWQDGRAAPAVSNRGGDTIFYDLRRNPRFLKNAPMGAVAFYFPRSAFDEIADDASAYRIEELRAPNGQGLDDPVIRHLACTLVGGFDRPQEVSHIFFEHVSFAVCAHVAQAYGGLRPNSMGRRGGLAAWQERRAKEILAANLDGAVGLTELARECRLSVSHFSRAFRKSMGVAPHRWLMNRRVELAKDLLRDREASLSQVALRCGFADQSHFTRVFSRRAGVSPGAWRRGAAA